MSLILPGATSGSVTIDVPAVAGSSAITLPASTGTLALTSQLPVAGPSFSAYGAGTQTVSSGYTKVQLANEEWDTANCFDNVTNYRFTPNVAGYYQLNGQVSTQNSTRNMARIYKNGSNYKVGTDISGYQAQVSCIAYANGTTDYFELYIYVGVGGTLNGSSAETWFQGALIRTA